MNHEIKIGIYEENGKLIGYKCDTFWSLDKEYCKLHTLVNGKIEDVLISNVKSVLQTNGEGFLGKVQKATKEKFYYNFETRLIGYEVGGVRTYTHRIFEREVQELDAEDIKLIEVRLKVANL